jgi:hypothetical protein
MTAIKYIGPFDEVEVAGYTVKRLGLIDVPSDLAKSLRPQEDWEQPKADSPAAKSAVKNPAPPTDPATGLDDPDREPDPVPPPSNVTHPDNFAPPPSQPESAVNEPTNKES